MYKFIISIIISQIMFVSCSISQPSFPKQLAGDWISVQFKQVLSDSLSDKIILNISPQLLSFDSLGKCNIQASFESFFSIGRPNKIQLSGRDSQDITITYYYNKRTYLIWTISNNPDYLFFELPGTPSRILFMRYKMDN